jgi:hypothetical protein
MVSDVLRGDLPTLERSRLADVSNGRVEDGREGSAEEELDAIGGAGEEPPSTADGGCRETERSEEQQHQRCAALRCSWESEAFEALFHG